MKEGSRGSKPGETPGTTAWMACTPEGCRRGSPVWHPSEVPRDTPPTDRGSQLCCDPRLGVWTFSTAFSRVRAGCPGLIAERCLEGSRVASAHGWAARPESVLRRAATPATPSAFTQPNRVNYTKADTFTSLHYHVVFSTKGREPWLRLDMQERVWAYLGRHRAAKSIEAPAHRRHGGSHPCLAWDTAHRRHLWD